jgi:uncharacterized protein YegL
MRNSNHPFGRNPHYRGGPFRPSPMRPRPPLHDALSGSLNAAVESAPLFLNLREALSRPLKNEGPKRTHMIFVLDGSLSMRKGQEITMACFNEEVAIANDSLEGLGEATASLILFNHQVHTSYSFAEVASLQPLNATNYRPHGDTALYDAIGEAVKLAMQAPGFDDANTAFFIEIVTDGEENTSHSYSGPLVSRCLQLLEATGRVTVTFMGPREGLSSMADLLALAPGNMAGFDPQSLASRTEAFGTKAEGTRAYMALRSAGMSATKNLYGATPGNAKK